MRGLWNAREWHKSKTSLCSLKTRWSVSRKGFAYPPTSSVPAAPTHPQILLLVCTRINGEVFLMKTIQLNQVYQRPKASVIWENCWNSKVIFCNVILPIEHWLYCTCRIRAQSFSSNAVLTSSMDIHLQVIIILVLSALILKWLI